MIKYRTFCYCSVLFRNTRYFSTSKKVHIKVAIAGASGGIGQPLSLLLKQNQYITELTLFDQADTEGLAADLSHINTMGKVKWFNGNQKAREAFRQVDLLVIAAGVSQKPGLSRDDLFLVNAGIARDITEAAADVAPTAIIAMVSNPINSLVPIVVEVLKQAGVYDPKRVFGVTTLNLVRASTFVANHKGFNPTGVYVPVIGGNSGTTIVPVISQVRPAVTFTTEEVESLTKRIQKAGTDVVQAKEGGGSTLSMAHAAARFCFSLINGLLGKHDIIECSYVRSNVTEAKYFATPLLLGKKGIEKNMGLGKLNDYEKELVKLALPDLEKNIKRGQDFITKANK